MLWTAVHLPRLSLDCTPQAPDRAFAVVEKRRIVAACGSAHAQGVHAGQGLAAALALIPSLAWAERDPGREAAALDTLALWALQFTSGVVLLPRGLLLETGGSARLFGGLDPLLRGLADGLAALGYAATLASSPTPTGARMLAQSGCAAHPATLAELRAALPQLPASALESAAGFAATFDTLGLRRVADVLALPRDGLARRFGMSLIDELDRALGRKPDPVTPLVPPESFVSIVTPPVPIESAQDIGFACRRAFDQLEGYLRSGHRAVDRIDLHLMHERNGRHAGAPRHLALNFFEPTASARRFALILAERLERTTLDARVERIRVEAAATSPSDESTHSLLPEPACPDQGLNPLLERLAARLGPECLSGAALAADHRPARAGILDALDATRVPAHATVPPPPGCGPRPVWLVEPPRPLREIAGKPHHDGPLTLLAGPERIESGWWDGGHMTRDYFIARTANQALLWIYRERNLPTGWFLQGYFA